MISLRKEPLNLLVACLMPILQPNPYTCVSVKITVNLYNGKPEPTPHITLHGLNIDNVTSNWR